jgi:hypothetical protein
MNKLCRCLAKHRLYHWVDWAAAPTDQPSGQDHVAGNDLFLLALDWNRHGLADPTLKHHARGFFSSPSRDMLREWKPAAKPPSGLPSLLRGSEVAGSKPGI